MVILPNHLLHLNAPKGSFVGVLRTYGTKGAEVLVNIYSL
jgi:hypothetical protein